MDRATLVAARPTGDADDVRLERQQAGFDSLPHSAVAEQQHRAVGEAVEPGRCPAPLVCGPDELRDAALGREDERERQLGGRRLMHGGRVGEHVPGRQDRVDIVVADRLALHEPGCDGGEVRKLCRAAHVRLDDDVERLDRRWPIHVPADELDPVEFADFGTEGISGDTDKERSGHFSSLATALEREDAA